MIKLTFKIPAYPSGEFNISDEEKLLHTLVRLFLLHNNMDDRNRDSWMNFTSREAKNFDLELWMKKQQENKHHGK